MNEISVDHGQTDPMLFNNDSALRPDSPFVNLNAIVLSIEWEITDDILAKLMTETESLKELLKKSKGLYSFLQLHGSIGKYIEVKRGAAHPDSIKLLHSVHNGLLKVISTPGMPVEKKNGILAEEIRKYNRLRERIMADRTDEPGLPTSTVEKDKKMTTPTAAADARIPEALALAVEEIKGYLRKEFAALREELKSLS